MRVVNIIIIIKRGCKIYINIHKRNCGLCKFWENLNFVMCAAEWVFVNCDVELCIYNKT